MRDPNRIPELLQRIAKVWEASPDLRLGQLLLNSTGDVCPRLYNVEDSNLVELLEAMEEGIAGWQKPYKTL